MSNTLSVVDMVAAEALKVAHEKATFISTVDKQFDATYRAMPEGGKYGQTLRVRNPNAYTRRSGSRIMDVQDTTETTQTITVATQDGVDIRFNSAELAQSVGYLRDRYIEPAVSSLVSAIDADALAQFTKDTYNLVGTAGTVVGASADISALHLARARLNQGLAPKDSNRSIQMDSVTMATVANGLKGLFLPESQIKTAFAEGFYARTAMADIYENERTWVLSNSSDVTSQTDGTGLGTAASDGGYTTLDWHTTQSLVNQVVGQVFTFAAVYACHPETKQSLGYLQQFVTTSIGSSGNFSTVSPKIYLSGPKQNVCTAASAQLATSDFDAKTQTFYGNASTSYRQNIMYHKDAFAFVTAELPLMDDALKCSRMTKDGLSLRVWQASDIRNDEMLMRIDILYGFKTLRPEWACRISN